MEKNAENRSFSSSLCSFRSSLPCIAIFLASLAFTCFLTLGFSPFLVTISILLLSTILLLKLSKRKVTVINHPSQHETSMSYPRSLLEVEAMEAFNPEMGKAFTGQCSSTRQGEVSHMEECEVEPTEFPSDSETTEDSSANGSFGLSWLCSGKVGQNLAISETESSVSGGEDDDILIEINLPESGLIGFDEGSSKPKLQPALPESICRQEISLMEIMEDEVIGVNEEDNLIEIDLSIGSIKCSSSP